MIASRHTVLDSDLSAAILRWPTERARAWTRRFLEDAVQNSNVRAVVAVGSAVRPGVPSLDLDLVVICDDTSSFRAKPPMEVDLRPYQSDRVPELLAGGHDLLGWAVRYGKAVFDRSGFWAGTQGEWSGKLVLPSAQVARERASAVRARMREMRDLGDMDAAGELAVSFLTHLARAGLIDRGVYPASRPELPGQLREAGDPALAAALERALASGREAATDAARAYAESLQE